MQLMSFQMLHNLFYWAPVSFVFRFIRILVGGHNNSASGHNNSDVRSFLKLRSNKTGFKAPLAGTVHMLFIEV